MRLMHFQCIALALGLTFSPRPANADAPGQRLALMPLLVAEDIPERTSLTLTELLASELRSYPELEVITQADIKAMLSQAEFAQMVGCTADGCFVDAGKHLGMRYLVSGSVLRAGTSIVVTLKVLDTQEVEALATAIRRLPDASIDAALDVLPQLVGSLMESTYTSLVGKPYEKPQVASMPSATAELEMDTPGGAHYYQNDSGSVIVVDAKAGKLIERIWAGDRSKVYLQRLQGRGAFEGVRTSGFWDPRFRDGYQREIKVSKEDDTLTLRCGETIHSYRRVDDKAAQALSLRFMKERWTRQALALARDEIGDYFYLDQSRDPKQVEDLRLFIGPRGELSHQPLKDAVIDGGGIIARAKHGRLVLQGSGKETKGFWVVGRTKLPLTVLDLWQEAQMVYTKLGVYTGQSLGTPCDPYLP